MIHLVPGHEEDESPLRVEFVEEVEDIYNIMRIFGEDSIINVLFGADVEDITEMVFDEKPKSFVIEFEEGIPTWTSILSK